MPLILCRARQDELRELQHATQLRIGHMMALHNSMKQNDGCCWAMSLEEWTNQHAACLCMAAVALVARAVVTVWPDPAGDGRLIKVIQQLEAVMV